jgi:hypothetical protein
MAKGGRREGAGGVSSWKHGKTKTIRVPIDLADEILKVARDMDEGKIVPTASQQYSDAVTESKVLDLARISIRQVNGVIAVYLEDLVKAGYKLQPSSLAAMVDARIRRTLGQ